MPPISREGAIARARGDLGLEGLPGEALLVHRLDRPADYYLVVIGTAGAASGAATVDVSTGEIGTSASLSGREPHPPVAAGDALALAGDGHGKAVRLVWRSCAASRSPLYPFWEVAGTAAPVYVDQQARVWLDPPWETPETRG